LQVASSTYYSHRTRPASARSVRDVATTAVIATVHAENYGVYGARKVHAELNRQGNRVARCTVERLMRAQSLRGISQAKGPRTTVAGTGPDLRPDLVGRKFTATGPDRLWVADITYCRTFAGWVYAAFVTDVFSRRVVGWQLSKNLRTDLALDALEMGIWTRQRTERDVSGLVHHSDRWAVRRDSLHPAPGRGRRGHLGRHDRRLVNALAEAFNSLFKAELVRNKGHWKNIDDLEIAVAEYIDWFNHRRLHGEIGLIPPAEHEDTYYRRNPAPATVGASVQSLPRR
jgi:putative transposase